jgi:hypothetical protein
MATLRDITTINTAIFTNIFEFNLTTLCLQYFLDREYKKICSKTVDNAPADVGSLLFFQVN